MQPRRLAYMTHTHTINNGDRVRPGHVYLPNHTLCGIPVEDRNRVTPVLGFEGPPCKHCEKIYVKLYSKE